MLIRDHTVIVYDNAICSTKIAGRLDFVDRIAELPVVNVKPIADVFRRIPALIPYDASHASAYSSRFGPIVMMDLYSDAVPAPSWPSASASLIRRLLQFRLRHYPN